MAFKIDKKIPMPEPKGNSRYPWKDMIIGDSFLVKEKSIAHVSSAVVSRQKSYPAEKYACRKTEDGIRVWRTA